MAHHGGCPSVHQRELPVFHIRGGYYLINGGWDLVIAHPPCTDLAVSGTKYFREKQMDFRQQKACVFFMQMILCNSEHIAVENPVGIMSTCYRKPNQIIQPWQFGHNASKKTCLWLKGLPNLIPTDVVDPGKSQIAATGSGRKYNMGFYDIKDENGKTIAWNDPRTAKIRSKTYPGIAKAMAEQWSEYLIGRNRN